MLSRPLIVVPSQLRCIDASTRTMHTAHMGSTMRSATAALARCGTPQPRRAALAPLRCTSLTAAPQARLLLLVRHKSNVPSGQSSSSRPSTSPPSFGTGRTGGGSAGGLFDVEEDRVPTTKMGMAAHRARLTGRYAVVGCLLVAMSASAVMIAEYLLFNPEKEVRERTTRILLNEPVAQQVLGKGIRDVSYEHMGARNMQAHHRFPFFGEHVVEMHYVLQGYKSRAQVHVQYMKDGHDWKLLYLSLDSSRSGLVVLLDARQR